MANTISPASIPPITQLREQLDYGDSHLPRCQAFYDSVRVFRKTFVTSQGWEGSTIHDWRVRDHRNALAEMSRAYLERHGNGQLFWPDDNTNGRANKLKYSADGTRLVTSKTRMPDSQLTLTLAESRESCSSFSGG